MMLGDRIPQQRHPLRQRLALGLLRLLGWKLDIHLPNEPKMVVLAAPHTSNWDGLFALAAILAIGIRINWFAKHTLFRPPFRKLLQALGGIAIDRSAAGGVVRETHRAFASQAQLVLGLAPEGTRARAEKWKSGFYQIAMTAQVPIVCAYLDYARKVVGTGLVLQPSGDYAADLQQIQAFYRTITPRHPARFAVNG